MIRLNWKNGGIYCKVSSGEKNQLYSISAQISALTKAVANVDQWKLTDVFIDIVSDKGESPRRDFERMLHEAEAHHISVILTKSISRFVIDRIRNPVQVWAQKQMLHALHVDYVRINALQEQLIGKIQGMAIKKAFSVRKECELFL